MKWWGRTSSHKRSSFAQRFTSGRPQDSIDSSDIASLLVAPAHLVPSVCYSVTTITTVLRNHYHRCISKLGLVELLELLELLWLLEVVTLWSVLL